jgi:hypothetical protein
MVTQYYSIRRIYIQRIIGLCILGYGFYVILHDDILWGILPVILGVGISYGADHGKWISFPSGYSSGGIDDSDGGGEGDQKK